jgi:hypothetical protein
MIAILRQAYPTATLARNAAKALLDAIAGTILTKIFVDHTVNELVGEEAVVAPHSSLLADHI